MRVSLASSSRRSIMASTSLLSAARLARVLVVASLPLAAMTFAPAAFAQDAASQDIAQARQLGQQAQAAFDAGNFAESEKLWTAAAKLYSLAPTLTLGLARTQAKLGHVVAAQESYNKIIREWGNSPSPPPAFKDALEAAKAEVGAVSAKVASVTLTVEGPTNPVVTIDGQTVPVAALGLKRPVDPGSHKVSATAAGFNPAETTFEVPEGGTSAATLKMEKAPAGADGAVAGGGATQTEPGADTGGKGSSNKTLAYVAFGVGGAGLLVGGITGILALGKAGDLSDKCPDKKCTSDQQSDVDSYKSMGTISTVGFIVAGVGGAAGLILLLTAPSGSATGSSGSSRFATVKTPTNGGVSMTPYFGGTSAGLSGRF
jgi:hypothetical protein